MPKPAKIEDAPHYLKLLKEYANTAITLSLGLLSLSVAFGDKLLKPPVGGFQGTLLVILWASLFLALISGLMINAHLTAVASNYMTAFRVAYPDALAVVSEGGKVKEGDSPDEVIEILDEEKKQKIKNALSQSSNRADSASKWANCSFVMFGFSSLLIATLGFYGYIYRGLQVDASSSVENSIAFVTKNYKLSEANAQFISLLYDEKKKAYAVEIRDSQNANDKYQVTIDASSGQVTDVKKLP